MLKISSIQDLKMNCKIILKHFALALILLNFITVVAQNTNIKSPALETLIQQIDKNYIPSGWNDGMNSMEKLAGSIPQIYFTFLGTAMKKQEFYTKKNPVASKNYKNLNQEILLLIPDLVDLKNSKISNNDQLINANALEDIYYGALMGNINESFNQNYKKNKGKYLSQISMPSVLDKQTAGGISYKKVAKKDKNEINLLGKIAPKIKNEDGYTYSPPTKEGVIPEDILVGTWVHKSAPTITFRKNNYGYVGSLSYPSSYTKWGLSSREDFTYNVTKTYIMTQSNTGLDFYKRHVRTYFGNFTLKCHPHVDGSPEGIENGRQQETDIFIQRSDKGYYVSAGNLYGYLKQ